MAEAREIESIILDCKRAGSDAFAALYPNGFILLTPDPAKTRVSFKTEQASRHVVQLAAVLKADQVATAAALHGIEVFAVAKEPANPWPDRVSIGRAGNVDLVVKHPSISKLHAHIVLATADLVDNGSTNGTQLNGKKLAPSQPQPLKDGDALVFGDIAAKFHTTAGLLHFIQTLL